MVGWGWREEVWDVERGTRSYLLNSKKENEESAFPWGIIAVQTEKGGGGEGLNAKYRKKIFSIFILTIHSREHLYDTL